MSCNKVIEVKDLSKRYEIYKYPYHRLFQTLSMGHLKLYKEFYALRHISFDITRGECVGIIGRNGAGKSTLLQLLAETLRPTEGSITVNGEPVKKIPSTSNCHALQAADGVFSP